MTPSLSTVFRGLSNSQACRTPCVGVLLILLGLTTAFAVGADDSIGVGGDRSAAAQLGFQILIPEELSAVFQAGSDSTPVVSSSGGQVTFTVGTFRSSENRAALNLPTPLNIATVAVP